MTNAVAKSQSSAVSKIDLGIGDDYQGIQLEQRDIQLPRIQMLQKGVDWEELNDIAWKPGDFFNSLTGEVIKDSFKAVVVDLKKTTRMSGPKDASGRRETVKFSSDGVHWDEDGSKITDKDRQPTNKDDYLENTAVDSFHYAILLKGHDTPFILTFKGASVQGAKNLNTQLQHLRPSWKCWTTFKSIDGESNGNKYKKLVGKVAPKDLLDDQKVADLALEFYNMSRSGRRIVSDEMQDDPNYDD